jgi:hypothetical protein
MQGEKSATDTNLSDSLDGLGPGCGLGTHHELGVQRLKLSATTDRTRAGGQLVRKRFIETRELILTAHEKRLIWARLDVR